jgi:transaldolase
MLKIFTPVRTASMKLFLDTANIDEIKALNSTGFVDGVTTNPSLIAKSGRDLMETIAEICDLVDGPVSAEVTATDAETMLKEGKKLAGIADNVTVKVPLTEAGLSVCKTLSDQGTMVNVTLCFSAAQALLAAKAGASFISPFVGRLDDIGNNGMGLIEEIVTIYANYDMRTEVLVASVRGVQHVVDAALMGADVATVPPQVISAMFKHPLTDKGLDAFLSDWKKTGQSIL